MTCAALKPSAFTSCMLVLLHSERPKLHRVLAVLSAVELKVSPFLRKLYIVKASGKGDVSLNAYSEYKPSLFLARFPLQNDLIVESSIL